MVKKFLNYLGASYANDVRYKMIYGFCFIIHSFYSILFYSVNVRELMIFNIASSVMYLLGFIFIKNNRFTIVWLALVNIEIIAHSTLCSFFLGYDYQFSLYSLSIIPVTFFVTYLDESFSRPMTVSFIISLINLGLLYYSLKMSALVAPVYEGFPSDFVNIVARLNLVFAFMILVSFSLMFIAKINSDMTELHDNNERLDFLANYDQLTELRNRNHIRDIFEEYIKSTDPYCVIIGDIDDFKHVNDTYGHSAGDAVLKTVASIIKSDVGTGGVVCRWGGEEILILLKGTTEYCIKLNEKILKDIRNTSVETGGRHISVTMTFGLCDYGDAMNIEKLISLADKRLYIGKKSGKNQIVSKS